MERHDIPPAKLLSSRAHIVPGQLRVTELFFEVPLDYSLAPGGPTIKLFGRLAAKRDTSIFPPEPKTPSAAPPSQDDEDGPPAPTAEPKPLMVYLEGGPGFGNREPQDHPLTRHALSRGYQLLLLDHRGVGLSTPVSTQMLQKHSLDPHAQADYLRLMRQDNTVRDCEAVRKLLTRGWPAHKAPWSLFGQSYGGFVALSYLSMHPEGLREVFLTGGLAPVAQPVDDVYRATYRKIVERNEVYYRKFPEDMDVLHDIAESINKQGGSIPLPAGGTLTVPRLMTMGIAFGKHGGIDSVHATILQLKSSLDQLGFFSRSCLASLESATSFDTNIIYAIVHEAIYCNGPGRASDWAAERVGRELQEFPWLRAKQGEALDKSKALYFSGEMIFREHFSTYPELIPLSKTAELLAASTTWAPLYDLEQLGRNTVPLYAAAFVDDIYVDYHFSKQTAAIVRGAKTFDTNVMYHSALGSKPDDVLPNLFALRDDVLD